MMAYHDIIQRSPEWFAARAGRVGSSDAGDIVAVRKRGAGEMAARRDLRVRLALERVMGAPITSAVCTPDMQRGIDQEAEAIAAYELATGAAVRAGGYVTQGDDLGWSPDGLMGTTHAVEVKCPRPATHLAYWRAGGVPDDYLPQIVHAFVVDDRLASVTFVSYVREMPEDLRLFTVLVPRDTLAAEIASYRLALELFLGEVRDEVASIQALRASMQ